MGASGSKGPRQTVVVVGGGYAGVHAAQALDDANVCDVVLVNAQEQLQLYMASPRALVEPGFAARTFFSYTHVLKRGRFVHGTATTIAPRAVTVTKADGSVEVLACAYVIIATGAAVAPPVSGGLADSSADALQALVEAQASIAAASSVVVAGGGPVGIEIAAEIKSDFPAKRVTLVHAGAALASDSTPHLTTKASAAYAAAIASKAAALGLHVILNARVARPAALKPGCALLAEPTTVTTDTGVALEADVVVWAVGGSAPNTAALRQHMAAALAPSGHVRVGPALEVTGFPGVFAVGDAKAQTGDGKHDPAMGFHAMLQAQHVAKTVRALLARPDAPLKPYAPGPAVQILTLGRKRGVASMFGWTMGEFVSSMKAGDMFTGRMRSVMRLPKQ